MHENDMHQIQGDLQRKHKFLDLQGHRLHNMPLLNQSSTTTRQALLGQVSKMRHTTVSSRRPLGQFVLVTGALLATTRVSPPGLLSRTQVGINHPLSPWEHSRHLCILHRQ